MFANFVFYIRITYNIKQWLSHRIFIFIFYSQLRQSVAYREIWHLSEVHNALIQLLNNSEKEKTVCRLAGEWIGWVKLRRQNELSHREKRSHPSRRPTLPFRVFGSARRSRRWIPRDRSRSRTRSCVHIFEESDRSFLKRYTIGDG